MTLYPTRTAVSGKVADKASLVQAPVSWLKRKHRKSVRKLPLAFEADRGTDGSVCPVYRPGRRAYTAFLTSERWVMRVKGRQRRRTGYEMQNAKPQNRGAASASSPGKATIFSAATAPQWIANVATTENVSLQGCVSRYRRSHSGTSATCNMTSWLSRAPDPTRSALLTRAAAGSR